MPGPNAFGRRLTLPAGGAPERTLEPQPPLEPHALLSRPLSPEAEAFRAEVAASQAQARSTFADWRRSRRAEPILLWSLSAIFLAPGLFSFVLQLPLGLSVVLEVAGLVAGGWIRRTRRRRLTEITAWTEAPASESNAQPAAARTI